MLRADDRARGEAPQAKLTLVRDHHHHHHHHHYGGFFPGAIIGGIIGGALAGPGYNDCDYSPPPES